MTTSEEMLSEECDHGLRRGACYACELEAADPDRVLWDRAVAEQMNPSPPAPDAVALDLEQTLLAVGDALNTMESRITALEQDGAEGLRLAVESLANMEGRLGEIEEAVGRGYWPDDQPESLEEWVTWLTDTYMLTGLLNPGGNQPSWSEVPAMRNELSALRIAARKAFGRAASAWDAASWHDQLDRSLARFKTHRDRFSSMQDL
ncbi:MAG: hypothetical protein LCH76_10090 [Actinobacteria bacterium]|nr:hypothetical protein [Actinomycetota bacterium]